MVEVPKTIEELARLRIVHPVPAEPPARVRRDLLYRGSQAPEHRMDVYLPAAEGSPPVVVFVHGGPWLKMGAKRLGVFVSYSELLASRGLAAVTFDHSYTAPERLAAAADDVATAIAYVRGHHAELGVDGERLAVWVFSGGGPLLSLCLRGVTPYVRALVAFYAILDLQGRLPEGAIGGLDDEQRRQHSPLHYLVGGAPLAPMLIARAGGEQFEGLNATIDRFVAAALERNAPLDVLNHPTGRHGFDILDDCARSRDIIARAVGFVQQHLSGPA